MIETECQKLVIDAVRSAGGEGLKLNNRFLVGVVDLLIKLPGTQPMWLEAKLAKFSDKTITARVANGAGYGWDLGVTPKQKQFLRDWDRTGMLTGVVSFLVPTGKNVSHLQMALCPMYILEDQDWWAGVVDHVPLGGKDERYSNIVKMLREFGRG